MSTASADPVVTAVRDGASLVITRCPHCGGRHTHGAAGGYGYRVAHCSDGRGLGYVLEECPDTRGPRRGEGAW